jgi:hypothetical protein
MTSAPPGQEALNLPRAAMELPLQPHRLKSLKDPGNVGNSVSGHGRSEDDIGKLSPKLALPAL